MTKIAGRHTLKAGFYNNHSYKAQNVGAGGGLRFQGTVNFGNDNNNPLDTGFGYANAATGVFTQYQQAEKFVEGSMIYNNTEFYLQDNWKVNNRLTFDYGMRFTRQQPQHDQFQQMSTFFPDQWNAAQTQALYVPGCSNGAATCTGNTLNAMNPRNGQVILPPAGSTNTQVLIGTPVPGSGNSSTASSRPVTASPSTATPGRRSSSVRASAPPTTSPEPEPDHPGRSGTLLRSSGR